MTTCNLSLAPTTPPLRSWVAVINRLASQSDQPLLQDTDSTVLPPRLVSAFETHVHFQADSIKSPEPFRWHPAKTTTLPHQSRSDLYRHGPSPTSQMTAPHPLLDRGLHVTDRPTLTTSSQTMMLTNMSRSMSTKSPSLVLNIQMWMRSHGRCLVLTKPPTIKNYRNS